LKNRNDYSFGFSYFKRVFEEAHGMKLQVGEKITFERTFTKEDVALFTEVSKDEGVHHVTPDEQGRFVVQGLLTSTLPIKIGGDYNVLARQQKGHS